jgi:hypothetical protein
LRTAIHSGRGLTISFLTKDYLSVGITWVEAMKSLGLFNHMIIAGDAETGRALRERGVPCIEATLDVGAADVEAAFLLSDCFRAKDAKDAKRRRRVANSFQSSFASLAPFARAVLWVNSPGSNRIPRSVRISRSFVIRSGASGSDSRF